MASAAVNASLHDQVSSLQHDAFADALQRKGPKLTSCLDTDVSGVAGRLSLLAWTTQGTVTKIRMHGFRLSLKETACIDQVVKALELPEHMSTGEEPVEITLPIERTGGR